VRRDERTGNGSAVESASDGSQSHRLTCSWQQREP